MEAVDSPLLPAGLAVLVIVVVALLVAAIGTAGFLLVRLLWRLLNA